MNPLPYRKPRPFLVVYQGASPFFHRLQARVAAARLPLFPYPLELQDPFQALSCLRLLDFAGLALEEALPPPEGVRLEAEAERAGRVDLLLPYAGGVLGQHTEGLALERFLSRNYPGARALWLGPLRPHLAPALRPLGQVSVAAESFAEGDAFLARLPKGVRGYVVLRREEAQALALRSDLLIHAGGRLPLELLQPFHHLLALIPLDPRLGERVEGAHGPEALLDLRVEVVLEGLGF
ncbi:hypothetical protein [Thermus sp.]|uniref:hypothetical protein n=1 Tax=Thermus sp. TaxID=275 RepID=UPI00307F3BF5